MSVSPLANIVPDADLDPSVAVPAHVRIGRGVVIGAGVRLSEHTYIGAGTRIDGPARIGRAVFIDEGAHLRGPLTLGDGTRLARGVKIGLHAGPCAAMDETLIAAGCTIGRSAEVVRGVRIDGQAFIRAHTRLLGDAPAHALVCGDPGTLAGFLCPCGGGLRPRESLAEGLRHTCLLCGESLLIPRAAEMLCGRVLLPGGRGGPLAPLYEIHLDWDEAENMI